MSSQGAALNILSRRVRTDVQNILFQMLVIKGMAFNPLNPHDAPNNHFVPICMPLISYT